LQQRLDKTHGDIDHALATLLDPSDDSEEDIVETFWTNVHRNLQAGIVRMVFVADHLPPELRRIIEFLNRYMSPMEVLGVTVDRMRDNAKSEGTEILVTSTIGMTTRKETSRGKSPPRRKEPISTEDFLKDCDSVADHSAEATVARRVLKVLSECDAIIFQCHRTLGGDSVCTIVRQRGGEPLLGAKAEFRRKKVCRFHFGKKKNLAPIVKELSGYDLPVEGNVNDWCAKSESNADSLIKWIKDAAAKT